MLLNDLLGLLHSLSLEIRDEWVFLLLLTSFHALALGLWSVCSAAGAFTFSRGVIGVLAGSLKLLLLLKALDWVLGKSVQVWERLRLPLLDVARLGHCILAAKVVFVA